MNVCYIYTHWKFNHIANREQSNSSMSMYSWVRHAINEHRLAKAKRLHYAQPLTLQYPPRPLQICGVGGAGSAAEKRKKAQQTA